MHFGRLNDLTGLELSLADDEGKNNKFLATLQPKDKRVYIGCPVWSDKGYVGKVYPKGTKPIDYLAEYTKQFNCIEVNATHYRIPQEEMIAKWKDVATPGFKYCPKFPQVISHRRDLDKKIELSDRFLELVYGLGDHLGPCFIQLPPHFKPERMQELFRFLQQIPQDIELAVEVRHEAWFNDEHLLKDYVDALKELGKIAVITDTLGRRDVIHQYLTTDTAFIRFNGNDLHQTDYERVDEWLLQMNNWLDSGLNKVYFFMHEPEKHLCADLAKYMIDRLPKSEGLGLKAPAFYTPSSRQNTLF